MEVGAARLLGLVEEARLAVVDRGPPPRAHLVRRGDHDHLVEADVAAGLVEERHLGHRERRLLPLAPLEVALYDARVEEQLEPGKLVAVRENDLRDVGAIRRAEAFEERAANLLVVLDQLVDDRVAGDRRGAVARECGERLALAGADTAGDRAVKTLRRRLQELRALRRSRPRRSRRPA